MVPCRIAWWQNCAWLEPQRWRWLIERLQDFLPRFNARFGVPAAQSGRAYRQQPDMDLAGVLCFKYQRAVAADDTVRFAGRTLQLLPRLERPSYAHARVEVQERLDGSLVVCYRGETIASAQAPDNPIKLRARRTSRVGSPATPKRPSNTSVHKRV